MACVLVTSKITLTGIQRTAHYVSFFTFIQVLMIPTTTSWHPVEYLSNCTFQLHQNKFLSEKEIKQESEYWLHVLWNKVKIWSFIIISLTYQF